MACLGLALAAPALAQSPCALDDAPCEVPTGTYRVEWPAGPGPWPVLVFLHGAGSNGNAILSNRVLVETFLEGGMAVLAPDGTARPGRPSTALGWSFIPGRPKRRDEHSFLSAVIDDATQRFPLDRARVVLSGFSLGGSMTWYMACDHPDLAFAYAPVGGAFWRPHPALEACKAPVRLFHTHGWKDKVVPLEGRPLWDGRIVQGDVFYSLQVMRTANACEGMRAGAFEISEKYWDRWWTECASGSALRLALHPGAHSVPTGWSLRTLAWLDSLAGFARDSTASP
ncbi:MAG: polyhydroxybutyrate depolymerase [Pseudomonadota bacterium]